MLRLFGVRDAADPGLGRLDAAGARHLRARRVAPGEPIVLVLGPATEYEAVVERIAPGDATCRIGAARPASAADPDAPVVLCVGLGEPTRLDLVVEKATELGATAIAPFRARRSQRAAVPESRVERWRRIALAACEQCGRTTPPTLEVGWGFEDVLACVAESARALVFVAPRGDVDGRGSDQPPADLASATTTSPERVPREATVALASTPARGTVLVIGPEGGLDEQEVAALLAAGARPADLGPRTLRFETAAIAALARFAAPGRPATIGVRGGPLE
ncbi:MAG: hypothetical protein RL698_560 [Pseudomonadota bacterium]|jgi:16S rRNA (uracil1498-N3)-methyltransferase